MLDAARLARADRHAQARRAVVDSPSAGSRARTCPARSGDRNSCWAQTAPSIPASAPEARRWHGAASANPSAVPSSKTLRPAASSRLKWMCRPLPMPPGIGLGHEGGVETLRARRRLDDLLQDNRVVGRSARHRADDADWLRTGPAHIPCWWRVSGTRWTRRPPRPARRERSDSDPDPRCRRPKRLRSRAPLTGSIGGCGAPVASRAGVDQIEFEFQRRDGRQLQLREAFQHAFQRRARLGRIGRAGRIAQRHQHLRARRRPHPTPA